MIIFMRRSDRKEPCELIPNCRRQIARCRIKRLQETPSPAFSSPRRINQVRAGQSNCGWTAYEKIWATVPSESGSHIPLGNPRRSLGRTSFGKDLQSMSVRSTLIQESFFECPQNIERGFCFFFTTEYSNPPTIIRTKHP